MSYFVWGDNCMTLKYWKCTKEKNLLSSRIDPGTNSPLGGCRNDRAPQHPRLYLYIVVGFILTTNELLCLTLHEECIAWCGGIRKDAWLSNNRWKRKIAPSQGSIPGSMVLWVNAGMMGHHSTHGYTSTLLLALYSVLMCYCVLPCRMSDLHDVVG